METQCVLCAKNWSVKQYLDDFSMELIFPKYFLYCNKMQLTLKV
jgi:hypothetical protein